MMLERLAIARTCSFLSYSTFGRHKVKYLSKEEYNDYETPYYKRPKGSGTFLTNFYALMNREKWTFKELKHWLKWKKIRELHEDQKYLSERHRILGPDLATAHFILARGGKIKFSGNNKMYTIEDLKNFRIPSKFIPGFYVQEVDASGTWLCYEGLENLCTLRAIKKLSMRKCGMINDWGLNRLHLVKNTLEYLDISECYNITERGISTLHELKNLRTLVIEDTPYINDKELVCILLQDLLPKCNIIGVNYDDPILLKRLEGFMPEKEKIKELN